MSRLARIVLASTPLPRRGRVVGMPRNLAYPDVSRWTWIEGADWDWDWGWEDSVVKWWSGFRFSSWMEEILPTFHCSPEVRSRLMSVKEKGRKGRLLGDGDRMGRLGVGDDDGSGA